jgi:hypothetical protein
MKKKRSKHLNGQVSKMSRRVKKQVTAHKKSPDSDDFDVSGIIEAQVGRGQMAIGSIKEKIQKGSHVVGQVMQTMGKRLKSFT